jgi:hypothetical protein
VLVFALVAGAGVTVMVLLPMGSTIKAEPNPVIREVLADFRLLLSVRLWPVLLGAALLAAGTAVLIMRRIRRAHFLLERRLRRLAGGEFDDAPMNAQSELLQFQEVLFTLQYAQEHARKKGRDVLLRAESTIDKLAKRLANEEVPSLEVRKTLGGIQTELNTLLEASRPPGSGKPKQ